MTVHVRVCGGGADAVDAMRSMLARQTCADLSVSALSAPLPVAAADFVVYIAAGAQPEPTAIEQAVWFLATHPAAPYVTGSCDGAPGAAPTPVVALTNFMATRVPDASAASVGTKGGAGTGVTLALALARKLGRVGGWLAQRTCVPSTVAGVSSAIAELKAAFAKSGIREQDLIDTRFNGLPAAPLQRLGDPVTPPCRVEPAPTTGLRILVLVQSFPNGGYTAVNTDMIPRLAARGHMVTTCGTEWWRANWREDAVRAAAPDIHHAHDVVPMDQVPAYIDWLITSRRIDVVLSTQSFLAYRLLPWLRRRHPGVAFVDYARTEWFEGHMYGSYADMAATWSCALDAQMTTSDTLAAMLVARGAPAEAMHTAYIGIDTSVFVPGAERSTAIRAALGVGPDEVLMLSAGRLSPEKRPLLTVDAVAALRSEGHAVRLVVAGSGVLAAAMQERAMERGVSDACQFLGELDETTLRDLYAGADIYFAPSEIEGVARTLYEAMAMGCVPVVSDVGGQRELITPETGSVIVPTSCGLEPYLPALRQWLEPDVRRAASQGARARIAGRFDVRQTVLTYEAACRSALARRAERQEVIPDAMAREIAVMGLEISRRNMARHAVA